MIKKNGLILFFTTCGALDHDIARHFSNYKEGSFSMDDKILAEQDMHRLGNIIVPLESYGPIIEEKVQSVLEKVYQSGKKKCLLLILQKNSVKLWVRIHFFIGHTKMKSR